MSVIRFDVTVPSKLLDDPAVRLSLFQAIAGRLNRMLLEIRGPFLSETYGEIHNLLETSRHGRSLQGGSLQAELGVVDPAGAIEAIAKAIWQAIDYRVTSPVRATHGGIEGTLLVEISRQDHSDVLSVPEGSYVTEKGREIDWLDWLLLQGDRILIASYHFSRSDPQGHSRTGMGIMEFGGSWRVPPAFAGVAGDNWITQALQPLPERLEIIFKRLIEARLPAVFNF